jgi:hypothetical protein
MVRYMDPVLATEEDDIRTGGQWRKTPRWAAGGDNYIITIPS